MRYITQWCRCWSQWHHSATHSTTLGKGRSVRPHKNINFLVLWLRLSEFTDQRYDAKASFYCFLLHLFRSERRLFFKKEILDDLERQAVDCVRNCLLATLQVVFTDNVAEKRTRRCPCHDSSAFCSTVGVIHRYPTEANHNSQESRIFLHANRESPKAGMWHSNENTFSFSVLHHGIAYNLQSRFGEREKAAWSLRQRPLKSRRCIQGTVALALLNLHSWLRAAHRQTPFCQRRSKLSPWDHVFSRQLLWFQVPIWSQLSGNVFYLLAPSLPPERVTWRTCLHGDAELLRTVVWRGTRSRNLHARAECGTGLHHSSKFILNEIEPFIQLYECTYIPFCIVEAVLLQGVGVSRKVCAGMSRKFQDYFPET